MNSSTFDRCEPAWFGGWAGSCRRREKAVGGVAPPRRRAGTVTELLWRTGRWKRGQACCAGKRGARPEGRDMRTERAPHCDGGVARPELNDTPQARAVGARSASLPHCLDAGRTPAAREGITRAHMDTHRARMRTTGPARTEARPAGGPAGRGPAGGPAGWPRSERRQAKPAAATGRRAERRRREPPLLSSSLTLPLELAAASAVAASPVSSLYACMFTYTSTAYGISAGELERRCIVSSSIV